MSLFIDLNFNVSENKFLISSNIKRDKVEDIMESFLRGQIGKGKDESKVNRRESYRILIELDLSYDIFNVSDDCGNKGLRDGIIIYYLTNKKSWEWNNG